MEINPGHPVTAAMHDNWHKVAGMLMWKLKQSKVTITTEDMDVFTSLPPAAMPTIIMHAHKHSMDILLMPLDEAQRYAAKHGELL